MAELALYTESFPYHNTETFLETEILYLSAAFDRIHIFPLKGSGDQRTVPGNVRIYQPVAGNHGSRIAYLINGLFRSHVLFSDPGMRKIPGDLSLLKRLIYLGYAGTIEKRLKKNLIAEADIHYSYWLNFQAYALSRLRKQGWIRTAVSRAHGFDLYAERGEKSLQFIQSATISGIDRLYVISEHGFNYLANKYPGSSGKFILSRLGTVSPGFLNPRNHEDQLKIVSCFVIRPVKRIHLIMESLKLFCQRFPAIQVQWDHLGGGSQLEALKSEARILFDGKNVKCIFHGARTNREVYEFYRSEALDVFLNTSLSEGLPVSVMEAQSCGIPVIATSVGGTDEIVNNENGSLLPADPVPDEIVSALYHVFSEKPAWEKKRQLSHDNWVKHFNAEINYKLFNSGLLSLATG